MNRRFLGAAFVLTLIILLTLRTPVGGHAPAFPGIVVKLSLEPPVALRFSAPATLLYLPAKGVAPTLPLSSAPWQEAAGGVLRPQRSWLVQMADGRVVLTSEKGDTVAADVPLLLRPMDGSGFELNGTTYPGVLLLWPEDSLLFLNEVGLEDYVCGVLGSEAYAGWPLEALKANAVAIRSYTLYSRGRHGTFDLCDTIHCQVYRGRPREAVFREAAAATVGEILSWQGAPINAVYHSSSGGRTRNNEEVWVGSPLPYLRSVEDFDHNGRNYQWPQHYLFRWEELTQALGVAAEEEIRVVPFYSAGGERLGFWVRDQHRGQHFRNEELRRLLSLPSPNFRVFIYPGETEITQAVTLSPGTNLLFTGKGSGHGVGLSQWGAVALAERGFSYRQILRHYYGSEVSWAVLR